MMEEKRQSSAGGRTFLHEVCSKNCLIKHSRFDRKFIRQCVQQNGDANPSDDSGITPLHMACTHDEALVNELLIAGADPCSTTMDGMSCLHLAARARMSNVLGILLDTAGGKTLLNATDKAGRTALHHACRSGRVESVQLLLNAGATFSLDNQGNDVFDACVEFQEESELWDGFFDIDEYDDEFLTATCQDPRVVADGLHLTDGGRPFVSEYRKIQKFKAPLYYVTSEHDTARLEEILDLLPGEPIPNMVKRIFFDPERFSESIVKHKTYSLKCLHDWRQKHESPSSAPSFEWQLVDAEWASITTTAQTFTADPSVQDTAGLLHRLLRLRAYDAAHELFRSCVPNPDFLAPIREIKTAYRWAPPQSIFHFLAYRGYDRLLSSLASRFAVKLPKDLTRPVDNKQKLPDEDTWKRQWQGTLLSAALHRELPNMAVVRVVVEELDADINELLFVVDDDEDREVRMRALSIWEDNSDDDEEIWYSTILHFAASNQRWWHARQLLPYLVSRPDVDVDIKNSSGQSPLQVALESDSHYRRGVIECLIAHGAEVDAVDNNGKSCWDSASEADKTFMADALRVSP